MCAVIGAARILPPGGIAGVSAVEAHAGAAGARPRARRAWHAVEVVSRVAAP